MYDIHVVSKLGADSEALQMRSVRLPIRHTCRCCFGCRKVVVRRPPTDVKFEFVFLLFHLWTGLFLQLSFLRRCMIHKGIQAIFFLRHAGFVCEQLRELLGALFRELFGVEGDINCATRAPVRW